MKPLIWMGYIAASLIIAYVVVNFFATRQTALRAAYVVGAAWIIWTLHYFNSLKAGAYQLAGIIAILVGITYVSGVLQRKNLENERLRKELDKALARLDVPSDFKSALIEKSSSKAGNNSDHRMIKGLEHLTALDEALDGAKVELLIASGWATNWVIKGGFIDRIRRLLQQGVEVILIYGFDPPELPNPTGNSEVDKALLSLKEEAHRSGWAQLKLPKIAQGNHAKAIIVDGRQCVIGSFNFLSNAKAKKAELSVAWTNPDVAVEIRRYLRHLVKRRQF